MRVSMKVDYAVRALIDLGQHFGEGAVQTAEIAARQSIPEPYLDQVLSSLRKAGFVRSRRGPLGGHYLAREPQEVSLGSVVDALEGVSPPIDCMDGTLDCPMLDCCAQQDIWRDVDRITHKFLEATSIAELVARQTQRRIRIAYQI